MRKHPQVAYTAIRSTWVDRCVRLWLLLTVSSTLAWYLPTTSWGMSKMTSCAVKGISFQCISYWFLMHFNAFPSLQPKVFWSKFLLYPGASSNSLQALYLLRGRHPGHKGGAMKWVGHPQSAEHCIWGWVGLKGIAPALRASAFPVEISPRSPVHLHSIEVHLRMPVKKGQQPTTKVNEGFDNRKYKIILLLLVTARRLCSNLTLDMPWAFFSMERLLPAALLEIWEAVWVKHMPAQSWQNHPLNKRSPKIEIFEMPLIEFSSQLRAWLAPTALVGVAKSLWHSK